MKRILPRILLVVILLPVMTVAFGAADPAASEGIPPVTSNPASEDRSGVVSAELLDIQVAANTFTVSWQTSAPAYSWLEYGLASSALYSAAYNQSGASFKGRDHSVTLSNLKPDTTYYFVIAWEAGKLDDEGKPFTVTTGVDLPQHPSEALTAAKPISLAAIPIATSGGIIISDEQFLSGFSLDGAEIQRKLAETGSVLADTELIFADGVRLPASEAISAWSALYTLSPAVLLSMAEVEHGLLSRGLSASDSLSEEEITLLSTWFPVTASSLATGFYQVYNAEATLLRSGNSAELADPDHLNAGSFAVDNYLGSQASSPEQRVQSKTTFLSVFTTHFGQPLSGALRVEHPKREEGLDQAVEVALDAPVTDAQLRGPTTPSLFKFPWTGNDQWNYNTGPHRPGYGGVQAYSSLDFQPGGMNGCGTFVATTRYVTASASGRVVQNGYPIVTLDHDLDGNRQTGWQSQYYHMANNSLTVNSIVKQGARLGNPSCNDAPIGLHVHFSQLYQNVYQNIGGTLISGWTIGNGSEENHGYLRRNGYPTRQSGARPGPDNWDGPETVLISDNCGLNQYLVEYFNGRLPSHYPAPYRKCVSAINHDWGSGGPGNGIGNDNFSARWVGAIPLFAGRYTFTARTDDGVRLWVSGTALVDYWRDQGATSRSGTIDLSSGEKTVEMEYYENGGGAVAQLSFTRSNSTLHTLNPLHSKKCLDVRNGSTSNFAAIQQYSCNRTNAQFFYIAQREGSYFEIRNRNSSQCLDLLNFSTIDGAPIVQYSCHGGSNQQWKLKHIGGKYYQIVSRYSGKCLAIPNSSTGDSVQVKQYSCQTGTNFLWTVNW